ncbi:uncharacterized protein LOC133201401 [Saccostrea echinata]|uniref:uncharacterized protein LOC133201401 n=1 Tax=Saccostrea echinata TaxID=191078 RepID=UPI002A8156A4|nr:uncharacterized protein LOC133201401 [Saccostrea echinata]
MIIENAQCDPNRGNNYLYLLQVLEVKGSGSGVEMMIENGIKEWITKCKDNLRISNLLEAMRVTGFSVARENIFKIMGENPMQVVFGRMKEHEEGIKYPVKFDIPFYSKTEDIAILEVDPTNLPRLPIAFALERSIIAPESIHIVGYPASHGRKQIFDPKCPLILEMEARTTLEQWKVMYPWEDFQNFSRACDSAFSGKEKVLFHCSESTAHGASGSPGLILSDGDKPKVYLMLQEGFPSFMYGNNCQVDIKTVPKELLIESGISMSRVYSLLSNTPYLVILRNAIFHT